MAIYIISLNEIVPLILNFAMQISHIFYMFNSYAVYIQIDRPRVHPRCHFVNLLNIWEWFKLQLKMYPKYQHILQTKIKETLCHSICLVVK